MELAQVIVALRRSWWLVVACACVGVGAAAVVNATSPREYRSQVQLFVAMQDQGASVDTALSGSQFTLQRVKSYLQVASSEQVVGPVVTQLRLPLTARQVAGRIDATNPLDTVLIEISATDTDPARAAAIANAVGTQFSLVVENLEQPADGGDSPVKVTTTEPAVPSVTPVSPRRPLNLALGLLAGLACGIGLGLLRFRLDTTLKTFEDVARVTGSTPLGAVPHDPGSRDHPLVLGDQAGPRAEAFRSLRTNLQFVDVDSPPRSIVITSPLPEEGKSTTACNIALTLAIGGARVVLVEADLRRPQACAYLGLDNATGLTDVLAGRLELRDVLVDWNRDLMTVLPAGAIPPNPAELLGSRQMGALIRELENGFDYVIIDSAPLLPVTDAAVLAAAAGGALIVLRHRRTRRDHAEHAVDTLNAVHARLLGTVINAVPRRRRGGYGYAYTAGYGDSGPEAPAALGPAGPPTPAEVAMPGPRRAADDLRPAWPTTGSTPPPVTAPGGFAPQPVPAPTSAVTAPTVPAGRPGGLEVLLHGFGQGGSVPAAERDDEPAYPGGLLGADHTVTLPGAREVVDLAPERSRPAEPDPAVLIGSGLMDRNARALNAFETRDPRVQNAPRSTPPRGTSVTGTPPRGTPVRGRHPERPSTAGRHRRH